MENWRIVAEEQLGVSLYQCQSLGGGDFAQSYCARVKNVISSDTAVKTRNRLLELSGININDPMVDSAVLLETDDSIFIKTHRNPPPLHFSTEAIGLMWLKQSGAVNVPSVIGVDDDAPYLAIEWVDVNGGQLRSAAGEAEFGRQLAALHQQQLPYFGREDQRSTGSLGLPNNPCSSWSEFYATQRLIPLLEIASSQQSLSMGTLNKIEKLCGQLDEFSDSDHAASLLHGDLWAGNRLVDNQGRSWLIDPACHAGHREFDLAMMRLFGGFDASCHAAYQDTWPLAHGWQDRIELHQLAPLIVHSIKFGGSYRQATDDAVNRYV
ncbi:MAG: fructosamine kinase family protein [Granulosicoccus sp.]|nr:fructosamine kinase family protein [Granulosicoccus sp.]